MNIWTFLVASYGGIQCVAYITYITRLLDWNADTFAITSLYSGLSDYLHILSMPVCWCVLLASVILPYSTITLGGLTVFFIKISYTTARITTQKRENWNLKECQITPKIFGMKISQNIYKFEHCSKHLGWCQIKHNRVRYKMLFASLCYLCVCSSSLVDNKHQ